MTAAQLHDRTMALHRRAYDFIVAGLNYNAFCLVLTMLATRDGDPELAEECTAQQIWNTAQAAVDAEMPKNLAFPYVGELEATLATVSKGD